MGCDIHLYVEKYDASSGRWQNADEWQPSSWGGLRVERPFYSGRNYDLFAILADVRNGRGFAGLRTGSGFIPISQPRGLPAGLSAEIKAEYDRWGVNGHSHSWLGLEEILNYDWTQTTRQQGLVTGPQYLHWQRWLAKEGEGPESYCGGVGGGDVVKVSEADLKEKIEAIRQQVFAEHEELEQWSKYRLFEGQVGERLGKTYAAVSWPEYYWQATRSFWSDCMPRLLRLAQGDYASVRIVFWFDN